MLRRFNNFAHGSSWGAWLLFFFALCAGPVGQAIAGCVIAVRVLVWLGGGGKPKVIAADSPEACAARAAREERSYRAEPPKRPRVQEPFLSREDYERKIREAMDNIPAWDFESTAVEEPQLALGQHA